MTTRTYNVCLVHVPVPEFLRKWQVMKNHLCTNRTMLVYPPDPEERRAYEAALSPNNRLLSAKIITFLTEQLRTAAPDWTDEQVDEFMETFLTRSRPKTLRELIPPQRDDVYHEVIYFRPPTIPTDGEEADKNCNTIE